MVKFKDNRARFQVGTGITSILMIFVVLCLTTFGILSYTTARMDENYAKKSYEAFERDCVASNRVETLLYNIDSIIYGVKSNNDFASDADPMVNYLSKITEEISNLSEENKDINLTIKDDIISFRVNIDDNNAYDIELEINDVNESGLRYTVNKYKVIYINDWDSEDVWRWN